MSLTTLAYSYRSNVLLNVAEFFPPTHAVILAYHLGMQTLATLQYGGLVFAAIVVVLVVLKRSGRLAKLGYDNVLAPTITGGLVVWIAALGTALYGDVRHAQALAKQSMCKGHMKAWALSMHYYLDEHDQFPSSTIEVNGRKHSWRVLIAPYYGANEVRDRYDFQAAWNSPQNLTLEGGVDSYFHCPDHSLSDDITRTSYVAITGPNCVMRDDQYPARRFEDLDPKAVLFVETKRTDIHWMEPEDLSYDRLIADRQYAESVLGGSHPNGGHYATVDGLIRPIASIGIDELLRRCVVEKSPMSENEVTSSQTSGPGP